MIDAAGLPQFAPPTTEHERGHTVGATKKRLASTNTPDVAARILITAWLHRHERVQAQEAHSINSTVVTLPGNHNLLQTVFVEESFA